MSKTCPPVYVVDDDAAVREAVAGLIRSAGLSVETFASAQEFLARPSSEGPSCLVLDVKLPGLSGLDLQKELAKTDLQIPIIFLTGHGDISMSVRAMKSGAFEFFTKPFDDEALLEAIRQAIARYPQAPNRRNKGARHALEDIVGTSAALKTVLSRVASVAPTETTVLILGETGTGKELVAHAIHGRSQRSSRPLVSVNCAAIQPSLIASELFGHEKGSFTGALQQRRGRFEMDVSPAPRDHRSQPEAARVRGAGARRSGLPARFDEAEAHRDRAHAQRARGGPRAALYRQRRIERLRRPDGEGGGPLANSRSRDRRRCRQRRPVARRRSRLGRVRSREEPSSHDDPIGAGAGSSGGGHATFPSVARRSRFLSGAVSAADDL
jgi:FixJ family two-component response regulator